MSVKHLALAIGAAIILPMAALATDEMGGPPHDEFGSMHHFGHDELSFLRNVTLTDTQRTQIHGIMHDSFASHQAEMQQMHQLHRQIEDQMFSGDAVSKDSLMALQKQLSGLRDQLDLARINTALQVRALLTPSQQAQVASTHQQLEALHDQEHAIMHNGDADRAP